jgi:phosphate starvation-inducible PhoH-like protein
VVQDHSASLTKSEKRRVRRDAKDNRTEQKIKRPLTPKTETQKFYLECLNTETQVFAIGGAGTGKTYLASRFAIRKLVENKYEKLIIARPTVAQKRHELGFLPGNLEAKLRPWLVPILSSFNDEVSPADVDKLKNLGRIEFLSFEHMRGRTFNDAIIILDEAQNCTYSDLKLFLTRIGENSLTVVNGDIDQIDIPDSGLEKIIDIIYEHDLSPAVVEFTEEDVVRSANAKEWVGAFNKEKQKG